MCARVQQALNQLSQASPVQQERVADLISPEFESPPANANEEPFRVIARDLGSPMRLTKEQFDIRAYRTDEEVEEFCDGWTPKPPRRRFSA